MNRHEIVLATLLLQEVVRKEPFRQPSFFEWKEDGDVKFCDARGLVAAYGGRILGQSSPHVFPYVFERIEFELIETEKGIKPHYHQSTDSVVVVLGWTSNVFEWDAIVEAPLPYPGGYDLSRHVLYPKNLIVVPRMVVHGFSPRTTKAHRLFLLSASSSDPRPPGTSDTFYV